MISSKMLKNEHILKKDFHWHLTCISIFQFQILFIGVQRAISAPNCLVPNLPHLTLLHKYPLCGIVLINTACSKKCNKDQSRAVFCRESKSISFECESGGWRVDQKVGRKQKLLRGTDCSAKRFAAAQRPLDARSLAPRHPRDLRPAKTRPPTRT